MPTCAQGASQEALLAHQRGAFSPCPKSCIYPNLLPTCAQGASQEALLAHQRGDFSVAVRLLCKSAPAGTSAAERVCALNNLGCIQARGRACCVL